MCIALKNHSGKTTTVWSLALLFATVTTILRSRICQKACDAAELDAERFYSVNLVARKPEKRTPQTNSYARKFLMSSQWRPDRCAVIAGALRYPRYRWYDRFMIKLIMKMSGGETDTRKEVVYTDWEQVANFAREIAHLTDKPTLK